MNFRFGCQWNCRWRVTWKTPREYWYRSQLGPFYVLHVRQVAEVARTEPKKP